VRLTPDTFAFIYNKSKDFIFQPGQFMEWTLPHVKVDERGNRRYFTIASSPTENELIIGVKYNDPNSSFKIALLKAKSSKKIIATQLAGDFVLPKKREPMVFVAGGIGITPFRSMVKYIVDKKIKSDIVLFYSNKREQDIVFMDVFEEARQFGVNTIYTLTDKEFVPENWQGSVGYVEEHMIRKETPDYLNRKFYVSGPQLMVQSLEKTLSVMGLPKNKIVTDYFPGFGGK
jgi:ferredoxin-NADP reductase